MKSSNKKLTLVTSNSENNNLYLGSYRNNYYIYNGNKKVKNSLLSSIYKPIKCSELYYKINKIFKWFQHKYLVIKDNEIFLVTKDIPSENREKPIYEINPENLKDNEKFKQTGLGKNLLEELDEAWKTLINELDEDKEILERMINSNEIYLLNNSKSMVDFLSDNTITAELIDPNNYSNTVDIKPILGNKIFNNKSFKVDISVKYSIGDDIYIYDTTINSINIIRETGKIEYNNTIQTLKNHIHLEFLNGIIRVFPIADNITDCIISNCLITYGN